MKKILPVLFLSATAFAQPQLTEIQTNKITLPALTMVVYATNTATHIDASGCVFCAALKESADIAIKRNLPAPDVSKLHPVHCADGKIPDQSTFHLPTEVWFVTTITKRTALEMDFEGQPLSHFTEEVISAVTNRFNIPTAVATEQTELERSLAERVKVKVIDSSKDAERKDP